MTDARAKQIAEQAVAEMTSEETIAEIIEQEDITRAEYLIQTRDGDGRFELGDWLAGSEAVCYAADEYGDEGMEMAQIEKYARELLTKMIEE